MPLETPARPDTRSGHPIADWHGWLRAARSVLPYILVAVALLGISEMLWLWHSWPVRQVLDSERFITGAAL